MDQFEDFNKEPEPNHIYIKEEIDLPDIGESLNRDVSLDNVKEEKLSYEEVDGTTASIIQLPILLRDRNGFEHQRPGNFNGNILHLDNTTPTSIMPKMPLYECKDCSVEFLEEFQIQKHNEDGMCEGYWKCLECPQAFRTKHALNVHYEHHIKKSKDNNYTEPINSIECKKCNKQFLGIGAFVEHRKTHHTVKKNERTFLCEKCQFYFSTKENLDIHILNCHTPGVYTCKLCGIPYGSEKSLSIHMKSCLTWYCNECGFRFTTEKNFLLHNQTFHKKSVPTVFKCAECDLCFPLTRTLLIHMEICHKKNQPVNSGSVKSEPVAGMEAIGDKNQHGLKHENLKLYLDGTSTLSSHQNISFQTSEEYSKEYECDICFQIFPEEFQIQKHKEDGLCKTYCWKCDKCPRLYKCQFTLATHKADHHVAAEIEENEKKKHVKIIQCKDCNIIFPTITSLLQHWKNDHPFQCGKCKFSGSTQEDLRMHFKTSHSDKKAETFKCDICDLTFNSQIELCDHVFFHKKKINYKCKLCGESYTRKDNLKKHLRVFHKAKGSAVNGLINTVETQVEEPTIGEEPDKPREDISSPDPPSAIKLKVDGEEPPLKNDKLIEVEGSYICEDANTQGSTEDFAVNATLVYNFQPKASEPEELLGNVFECDICRKEFSTQISLRTHKRSDRYCSNSGRNKFKNKIECFLCGALLTHNSSFFAHKRLHIEMEPFECKQCLRRYRYKSNLKLHLMIHKWRNKCIRKRRILTDIGSSKE